MIDATHLHCIQQNRNANTLPCYSARDPWRYRHGWGIALVRRRVARCGYLLYLDASRT